LADRQSQCEFELIDLNDDSRELVENRQYPELAVGRIIEKRWQRDSWQLAVSAEN
jgi:hypothetical protein